MDRIGGNGSGNYRVKQNPPIDFSNKSGKEKIIKYTRKAPQADWDAIGIVVCGDDNDMKSVTVLNIRAISPLRLRITLKPCYVLKVASRVMSAQVKVFCLSPFLEVLVSGK